MTSIVCHPSYSPTCESHHRIDILCTWWHTILQSKSQKYSFSNTHLEVLKFPFIKNSLKIINTLHDLVASISSYQNGNLLDKGFATPLKLVQTHNLSTCSSSSSYSIWPDILFCGTRFGTNLVTMISDDVSLCARWGTPLWKDSQRRHYNFGNFLCIFLFPLIVIMLDGEIVDYQNNIF